MYGCQFKSLDKLRLLSKYLEILEVEFGIHHCEVSFEDCFICPWITSDQLDELNKTEMEKVVRNLVESHRRSLEKLKRKKKEQKKYSKRGYA